MEAKGRVVAKAGNGKGFKLVDVEKWFNATDESLLSNIEKGDEVTVYFEKKGASQQVTKIVKAGEERESTTVVSSGAPACIVCGKALKDGKFKKCYVCNMKKAEPKANPDVAVCASAITKPYNDFNAEKTAQIQRGNALNAASAALSGRQEDPETVAEMVVVVAERFLQWLRTE